MPTFWTPLIIAAVATLHNELKLAVVAFYNKPDSLMEAEDQLETLWVKSLCTIRNFQ